MLAKLTRLREKISGAIEDVPDNLIGMVIALTILTGVGLGILMVFGVLFTSS